MKTLRETAQILDQILELPSDDPIIVSDLAKEVGLNFPISVRQLIEIVEMDFIDSQEVRKNIVASTKSFHASFGCDNGCTARNHGEYLNESQVNDFFTGSPPWTVDCLGAAQIIMAKGLIQTLKSGEFDKLGYTTSNMNLNLKPVANADQMMIGEWCYFRNDWNYLSKHPGGGYQGENVIKVGEDAYFGFPIGTKKAAEWIQELIDAYNFGLPPSEHISSIPGFQGNYNQFFNIKQIFKDVIKLRHGLQP
jgi:hypothetical protein